MEERLFNFKVSDEVREKSDQKLLRRSFSFQKMFKIFYKNILNRKNAKRKTKRKTIKY